MHSCYLLTEAVNELHVALPRPRATLRTMAGKARAPAVRARRATQLALSEEDAKHVLERVNTARMRLHDRLAVLNLASDRPKPGDHLLVQILLAQRDHCQDVDALPLDPADRANAKTKILQAMASTADSLITEAGKAAVEVRAMTESMCSLEQRAKEHHDKMQLLRSRVNPAGITTAADRIRALTGVAEPVVIMEDADAAELPSTP